MPGLGEAFGRPQSSITQAAWLIGGGIFFIIVAAQLMLSAWYAGKIYPGVKVAGLDLGGMTRAEARQALTHKIDNFRINLTIAGKPYKLPPGYVGVQYDVNATVDEAMLQGRDNALAPIGVATTSAGDSLQLSFTTDAAQQKQFIDRVITGTGKPATDAAIVIEAGTPKPQPDQPGLSLSSAQIAAAIHDQVAQLNGEPKVLEAQVQQARIQSQHLQPAIEQTKQLLAVPVTVTYQGKTFTPTPAQMSNWITYDKSAADQPPGLLAKPNRDGIISWLQSVSKQVNEDPVNRKIRVENGVSSEERAGKEGVQLDQDTLANQIVTSLASHQPTTTEAPIKKVAFQTEYNRVVTLDYGRYIEINLSRQHLWVYQDKQVIYESPITSGATGAGYPTVTGLFSIQAKQTNRNLNGYAIGYDYNVFVQYWMPFSGNYGLHDASWRSAFGGRDYYYGGSHGCVNLPLATAAFIYGWASVGTPVWVHN